MTDSDGPQCVNVLSLSHTHSLSQYLNISLSLSMQVNGAPQVIQLQTGSGICAMPDMLTWNEKGDKIYTACEGEPSSQVGDTECDTWVVVSACTVRLSH